MFSCMRLLAGGKGSDTRNMVVYMFSLLSVAGSRETDSGESFSNAWAAQVGAGTIRRVHVRGIPSNQSMTVDIQTMKQNYSTT